MNLDVYDTDATTYLGTLQEVYGIAFHDALDLPGSASFAVDAESDDDLALLQPRRWVRFRTGTNPGETDLFAAIVQDRPSDLDTDIEPADGRNITVVRFECPGALAALGYREGGGLLYPYRGLEGRQQNPRPFGWFSPDFDDSGPEWVAPQPDGDISTEDWPDAPACAYLSRNPGGRTLYRRYMPPAAGAAGPAAIWMVSTIGTELDAYLDGESLMEKPAGATGLFRVDEPYEDLEHLVAYEAKGGAGRSAFTWMELVEVEEDGKTKMVPGGALRRTFDPADFPSPDSFWKEYHEGDYPGVTVGFVGVTAVDEDLARAIAAGMPRPWSRDWDATKDSAGVGWTHEFSREFRIGPLGLLFDELSSIEGEVHMTPDATLQFFVQRGTDKTSSVTISSPFDLRLSGRGPQATRYLLETQKGFGTLVNEPAETELGVVMEQHVQLGTDIDPDAIRGSLVKQLAKDASTVYDEVDVELPDDVRPYEDVELGDRVLCAGRDGTSPVRLTSFGAQVDDATGWVDWSATAVPV